MTAAYKTMLVANNRMWGGSTAGGTAAAAAAGAAAGTREGEGGSSAVGDESRRLRNLRSIRAAFRAPSLAVDRIALPLDAFVMELTIAGPSKTGISTGFLADLEYVRWCAMGGGADSNRGGADGGTNGEERDGRKADVGDGDGALAASGKQQQRKQQ